MAARVLVVAWDGADRRLIEALIDDGRLPTLAAIRSRSSMTPIRQLPGLGDDAMWWSLATGVEPGEHGRFHHRQIAADSYRIEPMRTGSPSDHEPFWTDLCRGGRRVAILDLPKVPMSSSINGVEVAGWMPHGGTQRPVRVSPAQHPVAQRLIDDSGFTCHRVLTDPTDLARHAADVRRRSELATDVAADLLRSDDWDLFAVSFAATHCAGHHLWGDSSEPADAVLQAYELVDEELDRLLRAADEPAATVVLSPTGMTRNVMQDALMIEVVERLVTAAAAAIGTRPRGRPRRSWRRGLDSDVPLPAFVVPHDAVSTAVRVNVRGRESAGIVRPGAEYRAWTDALEQGLQEVTDATGRPLVTEVVRTADRYRGPHASAFADLLGVWNPETEPGFATGPDVGDVVIPTGPRRAGNHHGPGWLIGVTPNAAGSSPEIDVTDVGRIIGDLVMSAPLIHPPGLGATRSSGVTTVAR